MISGKCDVLLRNVEGKRMLSEQQVRELASDGVAIETLARDSRTHEIDADYARALGEIAEDERKSIALAQYAFTGYVLRVALRESVSLYGLVLALQRNSPVMGLPFAVPRAGHRRRSA
jgi:hypothetical protein